MPVDYAEVSFSFPPGDVVGKKTTNKQHDN